MDSWARSFLYRIDDISSFGNIMSTQNRFVQQNYVEKINKLRKYQRVKAPSHVTAKGTQNGALVTWRNEEPGADIFVVCRDGKEIASLPISANQYVDTFNGKASYTVYVIDTDGNRSLASIPYYCLEWIKTLQFPHQIYQLVPMMIWLLMHRKRHHRK